jgi:hypothetical protein
MRVAEQMVPVLHDALTRHHIRLTDEGELFLRLYCAVSVRASVATAAGIPCGRCGRERARSGEGYRRDHPAAGGQGAFASEENWLCVHIAARQIQEIAPSAINADDDEALVNYILRYINTL